MCKQYHLDWIHLSLSSFAIMTWRIGDSVSYQLKHLLKFCCYPVKEMIYWCELIFLNYEKHKWCCQFIESDCKLNPGINHLYLLSDALSIKSLRKLKAAFQLSVQINFRSMDASLCRASALQPRWTIYLDSFHLVFTYPSARNGLWCDLRSTLGWWLITLLSKRHIDEIFALLISLICWFVF